MYVLYRYSLCNLEQSGSHKEENLQARVEFQQKVQEQYLLKL